MEIILLIASGGYIKLGNIISNKDMLRIQEPLINCTRNTLYKPNEIHIREYVEKIFYYQGLLYNGIRVFGQENISKTYCQETLDKFIFNVIKA